MKQAILLHGTGGSSADYFWFADAKQYLEEHGYQVWWPLLPHTDRPTLEETALYIEENMPPVDHDTIIIGHSSACPVILNWLDMSFEHVGQVVLVSGFYKPLPDNELSTLIVPDEYDYDRILSAADEIILINSDNDPWGCDDVQARPIAEALDAQFILAEGQGHMGSLAFDQPYREFPLLKEFLKV